MDIYRQVTGQPGPPLRIPPAVMAGIAEVSSFVMTSLFPAVPQRFTPAAIRFLRMQRRASRDKARRELGYQPTSIVDAIQQAYDWFVERGAVPPAFSSAACPASEGRQFMSGHPIPRMSGGLPWLGHALEFRRNPVALLRRGREKCGELFHF